MANSLPRPGLLPGPLSVRLATPEDRPVLALLWQLFKHDMSEFVTSSFPGPDGRFKTGVLDAALSVPGWAAFLFWAAGPAASGDRPVGYALVSQTDQPVRLLASFFIVRGARRSGVGLRAACHVIRRYPGRWEIAFQDANAGAARLWRRVATELAGDAWTEDHRPVPGKPQVPPDAWISFEAR